MATRTVRAARNARILGSRLVSAAVGTVTFGILAISAKADALDLPVGIAANHMGEVYVSLHTDTSGAMIRRFSEHGEVLGAWEVSGGVRALAESPTGGVFAVDSRDDAVRGYSRDGTMVAEFNTPNVADTLSVGALGQSLSPLIHVIEGGSERDVARYSPDGTELRRWRAADGARSIAYGPWKTEPEGTVIVTDPAAPFPGMAHLTRHAIDGAILDEVTVGGWPVGMDVDPDTGDLWTADSSEPPGATHIMRYSQDFEVLSGCRLERLNPVAITVAPEGVLYVIVSSYMVGPRETVVLKVARPTSSWSGTHECTVLDRWDQRQLSSMPRPTATLTPVGPDPSDTPTPDEGTTATPMPSPTLPSPRGLLLPWAGA